MDHNQQTPLCLAAAYGYEDILLALFDNGASASGRCGPGTVLHCVVDGARRRKNFADESGLVQILLHNGADIYALNHDGLTALHLAVGNGDEATVKGLVSLGSDPFYRDPKSSVSPLGFAIQKYRLDIVKVFLKKEIQILGWKAMLSILEGERIAMADLVVRVEASSDLRDAARWTALHFMADKGDASTVQALLRARAEIDAKTSKKETPLALAARNGHSNVAKILLDENASVDERTECGDTPLILATTHNHTSVAEILLDGKANIHARLPSNNKDSLAIASVNGYAKMVELLLDRGAQIEGVGWNGATPLGEATWAGRVETTRLLVKRGANMEARQAQGQTPLHYAMATHKYDVVRLLLEMGADKHNADDTGESAVARAEKSSSPVFKKLLLGDS